VDQRRREPVRDGQRLRLLRGDGRYHRREHTTDGDETSSNENSPTTAPSPIVTGATNAVFDPMKAPVPITVLYLPKPS